MSKNEPFRIQLYEFLQKNPDLPKSDVAGRFIAIGLKKRTVYRWLKQYDATGNIEREFASGRPVKIATKSRLQCLVRMFNHRSGRSQRTAARKYNCSQWYISYILWKYTTIRCLKKFKRPLLTAQQRAQARPKCRALYYLYSKHDFVTDDESYFTLTHADQPGNDTFYSNDIETTPNIVKYNYQQKYPPKLLVWLAISPKGVSRPYFRQSGLAIRADDYLEIIQTRLEPFLKKLHSQGSYVFWPDLASAHYASKIQNYLKTKGIPLVLRSLNPANLPKARPIEDFWANLKAEVYKNDWKARNITELKNRINLCLRQLDPKFVQKHGEGVKKRLDHIRRHGVD